MLCVYWALRYLLHDSLLPLLHTQHRSPSPLQLQSQTAMQPRRHCRFFISDLFFVPFYSLSHATQYAFCVPLCVCLVVVVVEVGGGDPWSLSHMGDTSESSLLPEGPVKMQRSLCCWDRKGSIMNIFEPFKQVVFSWWPHQAVQEEGITVKKSFSRTSCCEILSWLHLLMGPTSAESAYIFMILHWRSHKAWETIHSICRQCGKRGRMRDKECTGEVLWMFP